MCAPLHIDCRSAQSTRNPSPAAEGNANLLDRPVPDYGEVSGVYLKATTPRW